MFPAPSCISRIRGVCVVEGGQGRCLASGTVFLEKAKCGVLPKCSCYPGASKKAFHFDILLLSPTLTLSAGQCEVCRETLFVLSFQVFLGNAHTLDFLSEYLGSELRDFKSLSELLFTSRSATLCCTFPNLCVILAF